MPSGSWTPSKIITRRSRTIPFRHLYPWYKPVKSAPRVPVFYMKNSGVSGIGLGQGCACLVSCLPFLTFCKKLACYQTLRSLQIHNLPSDSRQVENCEAALPCGCRVASKLAHPHQCLQPTGVDTSAKQQTLRAVGFTLENQPTLKVRM